MKQSLSLFARFAGAMLERLRINVKKYKDDGWDNPLRILELATRDLLVVQDQIRFHGSQPENPPELDRLPDAANRIMMAWDLLRDKYHDKI